MMFVSRIKMLKGTLHLNCLTSSYDLDLLFGVFEKSLGLS